MAVSAGQPCVDEPQSRMKIDVLAEGEVERGLRVEAGAHERLHTPLEHDASSSL